MHRISMDQTPTNPPRLITARALILIAALLIAAGSGCSLALDFSKFAEGCPEGEELRDGACEPIPDLIAQLLEQSRFDEAEQTEFTPPAAGESIVFTGLIGDAPRKESSFTFRGRAGQWLHIEAFARDRLVPKIRVRRVGDSGPWRESPLDEESAIASRKILLLVDGDYELHLSPSHSTGTGEGGRFIVRMTQLLPPSPEPLTAHQGDLVELDENFFSLDADSPHDVLHMEVMALSQRSAAVMTIWGEGFTNVRTFTFKKGEPLSIEPLAGRSYILFDYLSANLATSGYELGELHLHCGAESAPFGGGDGSHSDPYRICAVSHLSAIKDAPSADYVLTRHLNLQAAASFKGIEGVFAGNFDGGRHEIRNFTLTSEEDNAGFFHELAGTSLVKDLFFRGAQIEGENYVGVLAGRSSAMVARVGAYDSSVNGVFAHAGGLIGQLDSAGFSSVSESFFTGAVKGRSPVGGLIGSFSGDKAKVSDSYVFLEVLVRTGDGSPAYSGGLIGNVGTGAAGGVRGEVRRSYAFVSESPSVQHYGFLGKPPGSAPPAAIQSYFFREPTTFWPTDELADPLAGGDFGEASKFQGWDFTALWFMDPGDKDQIARPRLQFERLAHP